MKYIFILLLIFINSVYGNTNDFKIKEPTEPKIADYNTSVKTNNTKKTSDFVKAENKNNNLYVYKVTLIFGDKTVLTGITSFPRNSIRVSHVKKGFLFRKRLEFSKMRSLKILEWKPELIKQGSTKKVLLYYFYPYKCEVIDKKGEKYKYEGDLKFLHKLVLTNSDGSTDVYSYFADYWYITGKDRGYWKNSKSTLFYTPFKHPLKRVIKRINFR